MKRAIFLLLLLAACSGGTKNQPTATTSGAGAAAGPGTTKVSAFAVHEENLNVDKIAMKDGIIRGDGNRDLVFTATVEGPADALYLVSVTEKGEPVHGFRADTIVGHEEIPPELGSVVDVGRLTVWIAVVENGKFINDDGGTLGLLPPGTHQLKLYVPNTGTLREGSHLRLYARVPRVKKGQDLLDTSGGALMAGPIVRY
jgi:hypothetical protein